MTEHTPCPRCRHANPPGNRFCGSCGTSLGTSSDVVVRRENILTMMGHNLPAKLGPAGKVVAVGLLTLATKVGLSWLRHRTKAQDRPLAPTTKEPDTTVSARLSGQGLEEVIIQTLEEDYRSQVFAWRAIRSLVVTQPTDRRI